MTGEYRTELVRTALTTYGFSFKNLTDYPLLHQ
jgi:hypothetical protein